jgi:hypothetical protein
MHMRRPHHGELEHRARHRSWHSLGVLVALCALIGITATAIADDEPPAEPARRTPPSLDELLGLERDQEARDRQAEEAARREAEEALRHRLEAGERAVHAFAQAIEQMVVSADLLDARFDPGLGTQRIQEDIIAKLTHAINEAARQQQSQSRQQRQQRQQEQSTPPQQQQQRQQGQQASGEPREGEPPPLQEGDVHQQIGETRAEWGSLPERIREMLLQGRQEKFSSLYEQMTREYYRRLASE